MLERIGKIGGYVSQTALDTAIAGTAAKTTANITYYVDPAGDDTTGDGSQANPWRTIRKVWDELPTVIDHEVIIIAAAGTYYETNDTLTGKYVANGNILIQGAITVADPGSGDYTCTGGDDVNANGYGEFTVATAGWGVNAHAGKFIRVKTTTSPTATVYTKYIPIVSNTATTLVIPPQWYVPGVNTTFDIVTFDSIFTSATAAAPTIGQNTLFTFDNNIVPSQPIANDGLYYRYALTLDAINVKNGGASAMIAARLTNLSLRGINSYNDAATTTQRTYTAGRPNTCVTSVGILTRGNIGGFLTAMNGSTCSLTDAYGDFSTYTGVGSNFYSAVADIGSYVYMSYFVVKGKASKRITGVLHADGAGATGYLGSGRIDYATAVLDGGKHAFIAMNGSNRVYGANNVNLFAGTTGTLILGLPQANITYTTEYKLDDTATIAYSSGGITSIEKIRTSQTVVAATTIRSRDKELVLTATAPRTMTSTPTIAAGRYDGQRLTLYGTSDANTIELQDNSILGGSALSLPDDQNVILEKKDRIDLVWDDSSSMWIAYMPVNTPELVVISEVATINQPNDFITPNDDILDVNHTAIAPVALAIQANAEVRGAIKRIKDKAGNAGINNITITPNAGGTIDGAPNYVINTNYGAVTIYSDGSNNWFIISEK